MRTHLDIETYSEIDLKKVGVYKYAAHPSTDLTCVCWAEDDGPVNVWVPWRKVPEKVLQDIKDFADPGARIFQGDLIPQQLELLLTDFEEAKLAAHNAQFERVVLNGNAGQRHGVPKIKIEDTICTMAKCAVHGLPEQLAAAAKAFGTQKKRDVGVNDMRHFMKPRTAKKYKDEPRATPHNAPEKYVEMVKYCIDDVKAERDLDNNIPELTPREQRIYYLDQLINARGVKADIENTENAIELVKQYKDRLNELCVELTGLKLTQTAKLSDWIRENGYPKLPNLQAPTIREARKDPQCPKQIRALLKAFSTFNMKAVAKFDAILRAACDDGRLRGMMHYYGAGPGRWSSRIVQLQNMMRPVIKNVDEAIDAMWLQDISEVRHVAPDTDLMKILASCVRGMLIAGDGKDLMAYDFSQIESRIQAWLSGAEWKLKVFREGKHKIYNVTGATMFGKLPEEIVDDGEQQWYTASKIGELACIAENEPVLTDAGLIPIQNVTTRMKVWDGEEFVKHDGAVYRGRKEVISYDGLTATKDHVVWTEDAGPVQFEVAATENKRLVKSGAGWQAVRASGDNFARTAVQRKMELLLRPYPMQRLRSRAVDFSKQFGAGQNSRLRSVRSTGAPIPGSEVVGSTAYCGQTALSKPFRCRVSKLRRTRHRVPVRFGNGGRYIRNGEFRTGQNQRAGSNRYGRTLRTGEYKALYPDSTATKSSGLENDGQRFRVVSKEKSLRLPHFSPATSLSQPRRNSCKGQKSSQAKIQELAPYSNPVKTARVYDIVNAGPRNRFTVSNCLVHNCGYQGGAGAIEKFARDMDVELTVGPETIKQLWRQANKEQVKTWYKLEDAARAAIANPGKAFAIPSRKIQFKVIDRWLCMRLPSGRKLYYLDPELDDDRRITYYGINTQTRRWGRTDTYGGKLMQNACEGIGRDLLVNGMLEMEDAGYEAILSVHDEGVFEVPEDFGSDEEAMKLMTKELQWAEGLPVACGGYRAKRYRKD